MPVFEVLRTACVRTGESLSRRDIGKKARRFNAGNGEAPQLSPEGMAGPKLMMSLVGRPFGAGPFPTAFPGVETPGYSHLSLRDSIFAIFKTGSGRGGY